ncbi:MULTISPECIES: ABC transporter ATP-binding protein [unclassified Streptomyces]|uniref:ABC transporter ATP-binding protein n=1 Tax=unclassified Streptomyces TaxID=2593676 RepID=UPI0006FD3E5B|nr:MULTISPECIES: ABC transporter ATP-binding protein [unclassified Streptomyces]KQX50598.1 ABC transporter ATP-binding protein [Streptomyces sp. Root1304]KRA84762.1 ABC transporter ATP-binding protein [Streptomyces sp. Root66D1]
MSHPLLHASGIDVRFGGVRALTGVSLSVRPGEICGVIGPNGAGKTTLFDVLSGMRRPDAGAIAYDGTDITRRSPVWRARHGIRRTFQRQQLFGQLTVADNLVVAQDWRGGMRPAARRHRERAAAVLQECGLDALAGSYAGGLPVGRARMVELARALADPPRILLLDEPASGTTAEERHRLASVIRRMAEEENCAVLLVEHNVAFVMELCSRVVVLDLGRVLTEGTPAEVHADPAVREAYLGTG